MCALVTGVQTCALPIYSPQSAPAPRAWQLSRRDIGGIGQKSFLSGATWQFAPLYGHRCAEESRRGTGGCQDRWRAGASPRKGDRRRLMSTANRLTRFFPTLAAVATVAVAVAPGSGVAATYVASLGHVAHADQPRHIMMEKVPPPDQN